MNLKKFLCVLFFSAFAASIVSEVSAQDRQRIVQTGTLSQPVYSRPTNIPQDLPQTSKIAKSTSRPVLTNQIYLVRQPTPQAPLVKNTVSSAPVNPAAAAASGMLAAFNGRLLSAMNSKLGIPYRYGSEGPNSYDCSALVWTVFREAGINFGRSSARTYWNQFEPVYGDDRYKFGTLVFFNNLGHVGIVVDENGFYQASSSKGVTYTKFAGYWENRIVGFRKVPMSMLNLPIQ